MVWIHNANRTPFGKYKGGFCYTRCEELLLPLIQEHTQLAQPDAVYVGCANQAGEDARNIARLVTLIARLPEHTPAVTFNSLCSSSLSGLEQAFTQLKLKRLNRVWVGGVEQMSRAPLARLPLHAIPQGQPTIEEDTCFGWRFRHPYFEHGSAGYAMTTHAEHLAREGGITPAVMNSITQRSHSRSLSRISTTDVLNTGLPVMNDECVRPHLTMAHLERLQPVHGQHTAAHLAPYADGASGMMLESQPTPFHNSNAYIELVDVHAVAVAPDAMPLAGLVALEALLKQYTLPVEAMACIELHEAFASTHVLECHRLGLDPLHDIRLNAWGGALATGAPMGANGTALISRLAHRLANTETGEWGIASLASGMGMGYAVLLRRSNLLPSFRHVGINNSTTGTSITNTSG
jgi:acetyl-CoA acetyltransferase family protein